MSESFDEKYERLLSEWSQLQISTRTLKDFILESIRAAQVKAVKEFAEKVRHCTDGKMERGQRQIGFDDACDKVSETIDEALKQLEAGR